jgi:acyl carrier protein
MTEHDALVEDLADLVARVSEGTVPRDVAISSPQPLSELGLSSLSYLALMDAIETEYGIYLDFEADAAALTSVRGIAGHLREQGMVARG